MLQVAGIISRFQALPQPPALAENVSSDNVNYLLDHLEFEQGAFDFAILNAKGFGGNNGTALVASTQKTLNLLQVKYSKKELQKYEQANAGIKAALALEKKMILEGSTKSRYLFGEGVLDGMVDFEFNDQAIINKKTGEKFSLEATLPYKEFL